MGRPGREESGITLSQEGFRLDDLRALLEGFQSDHHGGKVGHEWENVRGLDALGFWAHTPPWLKADHPSYLQEMPP